MNQKYKLLCLIVSLNASDQKQTMMNEELPLSWRITDNQNTIEKIALHKQKSVWFALASVNINESFKELVENTCNNNNYAEIIIRGCNIVQAASLIHIGFKSYFIGMEAVLQLNGDHFTKKSVREMIRRGGKSGNVIEIDYTKENAERLEAFKLKTKLADRPNLKFLFLSSFIEESRLFVHQSFSGEWNGAILISSNSKTKAQSELLLRRKGAPPGVMENLIHNIFMRLQSEGEYTEWSLGEVPFVCKDKNTMNWISQLIVVTGRSFRFAYNYNGLYFFKNKFNPVWNKVYILARPRLKFNHLVALFTKTNLNRLVLHKLIHR